MFLLLPPLPQYLKSFLHAINQEHSMIKRETISLLFCFQVFYGVEFANNSESDKKEGLKMNWYEVNCAKYPVSIRLIY